MKVIKIFEYLRKIFANTVRVFSSNSNPSKAVEASKAEIGVPNAGLFFWNFMFSCRNVVLMEVEQALRASTLKIIIETI